MKKEILRLIVCPLCCSSLIYNTNRSELFCNLDNLAFPIRNNIPVLLLQEARKIDKS